MGLDMERKRAVPERVFRELLIDGDDGHVDELIAEGFVSHTALGDVRGRDAFVEFLAAWREAFPDMELRLAQIIVDGDRAAWRVEGSGTHLGPLMGIPATGKRVRLQGVDFGRIDEDGRLAEHWAGPDIGAMLADLGFAPPAEAPPAPSRPAPASGPGGRAEAERVIPAVFEMISSGDLDRLEELVHPDYIDHSPIGDVQGYEGFRTLIGVFRAGFPDMEVRPEDLVVEGPHAAWRASLAGTHEGELMGIPPTGRRVEFTSNEFGRVSEDGRAAEHWSSVDFVGMMTQLGVPSPLAPTA